MKVRLLGFDAQAKRYEDCLKRLGCTLAPDGFPTGESGLVLLRRAQQLSDVVEHVQALHHVFVQQHALSPADLRALHKLAGEAGVQVHFSAPALYSWGIPNLTELLRDVKLVQVYKDYEAAEPLQLSSLRDELLAAVRMVNTRVARADKVRSLMSCDFEVLGLRVDFLNAASAFFWLGSAAFTPRHELRFFGGKGMAVVNVLKREVQLKTPDGNFFTAPLLSDEVGKEKELADFVGNLRRGAPAFISAVEVEALRMVEEKINNGKLRMEN